MFPLTLNVVIDGLLKKEFDLYRGQGKKHPIVEEFGLDAVPFDHPDLDMWRDSMNRGIQFHHTQTNLIITGGVDDVWVAGDGELIVVDYKVVSNSDMGAYDPEWKRQCERQIEIYQWLFRKNGFKVKDVGYFLLCVCKKDGNRFGGKLEFEMRLVPHKGNDSWVENAVIKAQRCLASNIIPPASQDCDFCRYWNEVSKEIK